MKYKARSLTESLGMGKILKREENGGIITNSGQTTSYRNTNLPGQGCRPMDTGEWKCMKIFISLVGRVFFSNSGRKWVVGFILGESISKRCTHISIIRCGLHRTGVTQRRKLPG